MTFAVQRVPFRARPAWLIGFMVGWPAAVALQLSACSGDVNVHGVPKEIQLAAPFCVPSSDAGKDASPDVADAADDGG